MVKRKITPEDVAAQVRRVLKNGGSTAHAEGVQWFFKEVIKSHGWLTADLRKIATSFRRAIVKQRGLDFLTQVADRLFRGRVLEEKIFAVLMLEKIVWQLDDKEFQLFAKWIARISSWADHDGLVHYLIAPMVAAKPSRARNVLVWAKSPDRWHRRAACVALIQGSRRKMFFPQIVRLSKILVRDQDDMVQKGLGWLLRETAKHNAAETIPFLIKISPNSSRLVLRTACETLPVATRKRILSA